MEIGGDVLNILEARACTPQKVNFFGVVVVELNLPRPFNGSDWSMSQRKAPPSYSNPTQNKNSRPQFPFQYPSVELNAPRSSSLAKAIRGPLMEYLKSPGLLRPAVADAEGQNSGRDSMPEIQKLGSERHHTTGKRGRPAKNSRVHKRQNCSPQCSRPIVLALSAVPPSGARKRVSKKSAHVASAPSRSLGAQEPANPVWKGAPPVEVKSNEPTFSGSVIDSAKDGVEEDVKLFLELVHSLQSSVAKGKEGKAKETEQLAG